MYKRQDDSEDDPDFTVDSRLCSSDSEEDVELPKRRMKKSTTSERKPESNPLTKRGTPKVRGLKNDTRQARNERKISRNAGQGYITGKGKTVLPREIVPFGQCRNCLLYTSRCV